MTTAPPRLPEDAFFTGEAEQALWDAMVERVRAGLRGTVIAAPAFVGLEAGRFPIAGFHVTRPGAVVAPSFWEHALVTAVCLETNELHVGRAFDAEAAGEAGPGSGKGVTGFTFQFDALKGLKLPSRPGTYLVALVVRESVSNRVTVRLGPSPARFQDPAVGAFVARRLAESPPRAVWPEPGEPLPAYGPRAKAPPVPAGPGIALAVERVLLLEAGARCPLSGSFRLPVLPQEIVRETAKGGPAPGRSLQGGARPTAVLSITLLVTGSDSPGPFVASLAVPSFDALQPGQPRPVATGAFALDLLALPGMRPEPRTHFVYAFCGEVLAGPVATAFVAQDMLAQSPTTKPAGA
jgi:hypothetical protein